MKVFDVLLFWKYNEVIYRFKDNKKVGSGITRPSNFYPGKQSNGNIWIIYDDYTLLYHAWEFKTKWKASRSFTYWF